MTELLLKEEVYAIVGAALEVHRELGPGFLEAVYYEPLEIEMQARGIPCDPQHSLPIFYKGQELRKHYTPDYVCFDQIVVEIKALEALTNHELAQVLNYLKAARLRVGVLINLGSRGKLEWKRLVF